MNLDQILPLNVQNNRFSVQIPTQIKNQKLFIEQSSEGLKVSTTSGDGIVRTIQKYMIQGLPKLNVVPKEFFDQCYARLVKAGSDYKVYFNLPVNGGMFQPNPLVIVVNDYPRSDLQITEFYANPQVARGIDHLRKTAAYSLKDVVDYLKSGAQAVSIAFLSGRSFPVAGPLLMSAKNQYSNVVTHTVGKFIDMKKSTVSIIIQHSQACDYARIGQLANALNALKTAQLYADQNLAACQELWNMAEDLCTTLMESSNALVITDVRLIAAENQLKELNAQLTAVNNEIALAEQEERNSIAQMQKADRPKYLRALLHKVIYRRAPTPNPQIAAAHDANRKKYYELQLQQKQIQIKKIEEKRNLNSILASLLGDFGDTQLGRAAISSALAGLDEVKTAIQYYKNFMKEVSGNTAIAVQTLTNLVELGGEIELAKGGLPTPVEMEVFDSGFRQSLYSWIPLHCFLGGCIPALCNAQKDVHDILQLTALTPGEQLQQAQSSLNSLLQILADRSNRKRAQIQEMAVIVNNPEIADRAIDQF